MRMNKELRLLNTVGKADMCELLSHAFAFPDKELASALTDGSFTADCASCLADAGCEDADGLVVGLQAALAAKPSLYELMRREYSLLFLNPAKVVVYPYESAFLHRELEREGSPSLFRSSVTLDVESHMRGAGVMAKDGRTEPCDSVYRELEFLSFLYGSLASAIQQKNAEAEALWQNRTSRFLEQHVLRWVPLFMKRTVEHSHEGVYGALAQPAIAFLASLAEEFNR